MKDNGYFFVLVLLAAIILCCSPDQRHGRDTVGNGKELFASKSDDEEVARFVADAIRTRYAEIKLAELASIKSSNSEVLGFAQDLANGHTNSLTAFQALAERKGMTVPRKEDEETKKTINELAQGRDADFDEKWCDRILTMHENAIRNLKAMSKRTDDADFREIIDRSLASTQARFDKLQDLKKSLP